MEPVNTYRALLEMLGQRFKDWSESDHPRDDIGRFTDKEGRSGSDRAGARSGYTGRKPDKAGRVRCYQSGKQVACSSNAHSGGEPDEHYQLAATSVRRLSERSGQLDPAAVHEALQAVRSLSADEVAGIKKGMGVRAGGKKEQQARKLVDEAARELRERQKWARKARAAGVKPDDLYAMAGEVHKLAGEYQKQVKGMLAETRQLFKETTGNQLTRGHPAFKGGDTTDLPSFDLISRTMAGRYPEILGNHGYDGDGDETGASQKLFDLLAEGTPRPPRRSEAYREAFEHLSERASLFGQSARQSEDEVPFDINDLIEGIDVGEEVEKPAESPPEKPAKKPAQSQRSEHGYEFSDRVAGAQKKLRAMHDEAQKHQAVIDDIERQKGNLYKARDEGRITGKQMLKEISDLSKKAMPSRAALIGHAATARESLLRAVGGDSRITVTGKGETVEGSGSPAALGAKFVSGLLRGAGTVDVAFVHAGSAIAGRPYFLPTENHISLQQGAQAHHAAHELGHWIEHNVPGARDAAQEFLQKRVGSEQLTSIKDKFGQGYGSSETGRKDNFGKVFGDGPEAYYVGKHYGEGDTEILAMGIEQLYRDPAGFAAKDPEYFQFVVSVLDGSGRKGNSLPKRIDFGKDG